MGGQLQKKKGVMGRPPGLQGGPVAQLYPDSW